MYFLATKLLESLAQSLLLEKLLSFFLEEIFINIFLPLYLNKSKSLHSVTFSHGSMGERLLVKFQDTFIHDPFLGDWVVSVSSALLSPDCIDIKLFPGIPAVFDQLHSFEPSLLSI